MLDESQYDIFLIALINIINSLKQEGSRNIFTSVIHTYLTPQGESPVFNVANSNNKQYVENVFITFIF